MTVSIIRTGSGAIFNPERGMYHTRGKNFRVWVQLAKNQHGETLVIQRVRRLMAGVRPPVILEYETTSNINTLFAIHYAVMRAITEDK